MDLLDTGGGALGGRGGGMGGGGGISMWLSWAWREGTRS